VYNIQSSVIQVSEDENFQHDLHVVILGGGMSAEREVSLSSANGMFSHLSPLSYRKITLVDMGRDIAVLLHELQPDVVVNALHGLY
jgi:D-alanine-D-alanine ligase